jgi:hypothetical protein
VVRILGRPRFQGEEWRPWRLGREESKVLALHGKVAAAMELVVGSGVWGEAESQALPLSRRRAARRSPATTSELWSIPAARTSTSSSPGLSASSSVGLLQLPKLAATASSRASPFAPPGRASPPPCAPWPSPWSCGWIHCGLM